jgi:hypothetical protein
VEIDAFSTEVKLTMLGTSVGEYATLQYDNECLGENFDQYSAAVVVLMHLIHQLRQLLRQIDHSEGACADVGSVNAVQHHMNAKR